MKSQNLHCTSFLVFLGFGTLGNARHSSGPSIVVKNPELALRAAAQKVLHQEVMPELLERLEFAILAKKSSGIMLGF